MSTNAVSQSGSIAPLSAQYVTLALDSTLTAERVLTGTANQITITDNGANSTVVLSLPQSIATSSTPTFGGLTITGGTVTIDPVETTTNNMYSFVMDPPVTNLCARPSFESTDLTGWAANGAGASIARSTAIAKQGSASLRVNTTGTINTGVKYTVSGLASNTNYVFSFFGATLTGSTSGISTSVTGNVSGSVLSRSSSTPGFTTTWQRVFTYWRTTTDTSADFAIIQSNALTQEWYVDCVQCEASTEGSFTVNSQSVSFPSSYADGSMGNGYAWTGTAHESTSTRTGGSHFLAPLTAGGSFGLVVKRDGSLGASHVLFAPEYRSIPSIIDTVAADGSVTGVATEFFKIAANVFTNVSLGTNYSLARISNDSGGVLAVDCGALTENALSVSMPNATTGTILAIYAPRDLTNFTGNYFSFADKSQRNMYQWKRDSCTYGTTNLGYVKASYFYGGGAYSEAKTATSGTASWATTTITGSSTTWNTVGVDRIFPGDVVKLSGDPDISVVTAVGSDTSLTTLGSNTVGAGATLSRSSQQYGPHPQLMEGPYGDHVGVGKGDATSAFFVTSSDRLKLFPTAFTANTALSGSPTLSMSSGSTSGTFSGAVSTSTDCAVGDWIHPVGHPPLRVIQRGSTTAFIAVDPIDRTGAISALSGVAFYIQKANAMTVPTSDASGDGIVQRSWFTQTSAGPTASTSEVSLLGTPLIIRARHLDTNSAYRINLRGTLTSGNIAATLTLKFKMNGTTILTNVETIVVLTAQNFNYEAIISANNSLAAQKVFHTFTSQPATDGAAVEHIHNYATASQNMKTDTVIDITAQWSLASSMSCEFGYGEVL